MIQHSVFVKKGDDIQPIGWHESLTIRDYLELAGVKVSDNHENLSKCVTPWATIFVHPSVESENK